MHFVIRIKCVRVCVCMCVCTFRVANQIRQNDCVCDLQCDCHVVFMLFPDSCGEKSVEYGKLCMLNA